MSLAPTCFENVIGLSRTDCECFEDPPEGFDVSASGIYLDEAPGMNLEKVFGEAGCKNTGWEIMEKAREYGLKRMIDETLKAVRSETKLAKPALRAQVGDIKDGTGTVRLPKTYHGIDMLLPEHVGGSATLKRIGAYVKFTGTITVSVYQEGTDTPIDAFVVDTQANSLVWTTVSMDALSMDRQARYWFLWEPTSGQEALNSRVHCGCGGTPSWNLGTPWFIMSPERSQEWYQWAMAFGTYGDSLSGRETWQHNNATQGILLDIDFKCDARTVLCNGTPDYEQDQLQSTFAFGVMFAAASWILDYVSGGHGVNRASLAGGDEMASTKLSYEKEFAHCVAYLGQELSREPEDGQRASGVNIYSDCFACKDKSGIKVQTIRR